MQPQKLTMTLMAQKQNQTNSLKGQKVDETVNLIQFPTLANAKE